MLRRLRWPILIAGLAAVTIIALLMARQPDLLPIAPVVVPAEGGIYAEGLIGSMVRINPLLDYYNPTDRDVSRLIFSGLVRFDGRGLPQGDLADSWGVSRDGVVYNFSLRSQAVWHDGTPVTSDDVIFTVELMRQDDAPLPADVRAMWNQIDVQRLNDKTLRFSLPEPYAPFLDYLTFGVLPAHILGDLSLTEILNDPFNLAPIGTGPYRFESLAAEDGQIVGVNLRSFPQYYLEPAFIDQVVFRYYPDAQALLAAYRNGDILGLGQVPLEILPDVLAEPELGLHTGRLPVLSMVFLNLADENVAFFQTTEVRQALLSGLNRQRIIDRMLGGQAILADGPIFPGTWAYYEGTPRVEYDSDAAINLLRTAGYTIPASGGDVRTDDEGLPLAFSLLHEDSPEQTQLAEAIAEDWAKLGVGVTLQAASEAEMIDLLAQHNYQAALANLDLARSPDPDPYPFWHQAEATGGQNYSQWDDRQASEYLEQARITIDLQERTRLYRNFQVRFSKMQPALPLFYPVYRYAVKNQVQGVRMGPLFDPSDRFNTVADWFLETRRSPGQQPTATSAPAAP